MNRLCPGGHPWAPGRDWDARLWETDPSTAALQTRRVLIRLLNSCSQRDRYARFGGRLTVTAAVAQMTPPLGGGEIHAALDLSSGHLAGALDAHHTSAGRTEAAIIVAPQWRRRGLACRLIELALEQSTREVYFVVSETNRPARALARHLGGVSTAIQPGMLEIVLPESIAAAHRRGRQDFGMSWTTAEPLGLVTLMGSRSITRS